MLSQPAESLLSAEKEEISRPAERSAAEGISKARYIGGTTLYRLIKLCC